MSRQHSFAELEKTMLEREEHMQIYWGKELYSKAANVADHKKEEHKIYHWYYQFFMIIEVVFYAKKKGLLDKGQWDGWLSTVDGLIEIDRDHFVWAWVDSRNNYSEGFRSDINKRAPCLFCEQLISEHLPLEGRWDILYCTKCKKECDYRH